MSGKSAKPKDLNKKTAAKIQLPSFGAGSRGYYRTYDQNALAAIAKANANRNTVGPAVSRGARPSSTGLPSPLEAQLIAANNKKTDTKGKGKGGKKDNKEKPVSMPPNEPPTDFEFNLPPHAWSLPVRPSTVVGTEFTNGALTNETIHRERRGLIWHWDAGELISSTDAEGATSTAADEQEKFDKTNKSKLGANSVNNYRWGFQFLWNPENISTSIERNMSVTPSSADRFRSVAGAFPGQESYTFTLTLDRVNDFACIKNFLPPKKNPDTGKTEFQADLIDFYKHGYGTVSESQMRTKISNLAKYGTMADLEYLFKALNGNGKGSNPDKPGATWSTLLKKPTANIGFLSPSLLAFRFGPDATTSLSFVGWIVNLGINHTMFTEDMIPIRTTVSFSCSAFAGSTIA
jgi:hypothetical protein